MADEKTSIIEKIKNLKSFYKILNPNTAISSTGAVSADFSSLKDILYERILYNSELFPRSTEIDSFYVDEKAESFAEIFYKYSNPKKGVPIMLSLRKPKTNTKNVIYQVIDNFISPEIKYVEDVDLFMNGIPTVVMSQCVPYFDIVFEFEDPLIDDSQGVKVIRRLNNEFNFFRSPEESYAKKIKRFGMEYFTMPQSLNTDLLLTNTDKKLTNLKNNIATDNFKPFLTLESFTIDVVNPRDFFSFRNANATIKLLDKTRLKNFAQFFKPENYSKTSVYVTQGWVCPANINNPYADFINKKFIKTEVYGIGNSSYSFEAGNSVTINLALFNKYSKEIGNVPLGVGEGDILRLEILNKLAAKIKNTLNSLSLKTSKLLFSNSDDDLLPKKLITASETGTPFIGIEIGKIKTTFESLDFLMQNKELDQDKLIQIQILLAQYLICVYAPETDVTGLSQKLFPPKTPGSTQTPDQSLTELNSARELYLQAEKKFLDENLSIDLDLLDESLEINLKNTSGNETDTIQNLFTNRLVEKIGRIFDTIIKNANAKREGKKDNFFWCLIPILKSYLINGSPELKKNLKILKAVLNNGENGVSGTSRTLSKQSVKAITDILFQKGGKTYYKIFFDFQDTDTTASTGSKAKFAVKNEKIKIWTGNNQTEIDNLSYGKGNDFYLFGTANFKFHEFKTVSNEFLNNCCLPIDAEKINKNSLFGLRFIQGDSTDKKKLFISEAGKDGEEIKNSPSEAGIEKLFFWPRAGIFQTEVTGIKNPPKGYTVFQSSQSTQHKGIDIGNWSYSSKTKEDSQKKYMPVRAINDGEVIEINSKTEGAGPRYVKIKHMDGKNVITTRYLHLKKNPTDDSQKNFVYKNTFNGKEIVTSFGELEEKIKNTQHRDFKNFEKKQYSDKAEIDKDGKLIVKKGAIIGYIERTSTDPSGNEKTGNNLNHLHFEVYVNQVIQDPELVFQNWPWAGVPYQKSYDLKLKYNEETYNPFTVEPVLPGNSSGTDVFSSALGASDVAGATQDALADILKNFVDLSTNDPEKKKRLYKKNVETLNRLFYEVVHKKINQIRGSLYDKFLENLKNYLLRKRTFEKQEKINEHLKYLKENFDLGAEEKYYNDYNQLEEEGTKIGPTTEIDGQYFKISETITTFATIEVSKITVIEQNESYVNQLIKSFKEKNYEKKVSFISNNYNKESFGFEEPVATQNDLLKAILFSLNSTIKPTNDKKVGNKIPENYDHEKVERQDYATFYELFNETKEERFKNFIKDKTEPNLQDLFFGNEDGIKMFGLKPETFSGVKKGIDRNIFFVTSEEQTKTKDIFYINLLDFFSKLNIDKIEQTPSGGGGAAKTGKIYSIDIKDTLFNSKDAYEIEKNELKNLTLFFKAIENIAKLKEDEKTLKISQLYFVLSKIASADKKEFKENSFTDYGKTLTYYLEQILNSFLTSEDVEKAIEKPTTYKGKDSFAYSSFGNIFSEFVQYGLGLSTAADSDTDIQIIFYTFNESAGPILSNLPICMLPVELYQFKNELAKTITEKKDAFLTVGSFLEVFNQQIFKDPRSIFNPLSREYFNYEPDQKPTKILDDKNATLETIGIEPIKIPTLHAHVETIVKEQIDGEYLVCNGDRRFAEKQKKILRIHIFDKQKSVFSQIKEVNFNEKENNFKVTYNVGNLVKAGGLEVQSTKTVNFGATEDPNSAYRDFQTETIPTIQIGASTSNVTAVSISSNQNPRDTANRVTQFYKSDTEIGGNLKNNDIFNLPIRVIPANLSMTTVGCQLFEIGQNYYIDLGTGTTLDGVYLVTKVTHNISQGKFETNLEFAPKEGLEQFETAIINKPKKK